jgi:BolA protein
MSTGDPLIEEIRAALARLEPSALHIRDDSALHAGHAGARSGGGHYQVEIEAAVFAGRTLLARHRQIHAALGNLMGGPIHALAILARAPGETAAEHAPSPSTTPIA